MRLALIDRGGASSEAAVRIVPLAEIGGLPEAFRAAGPALAPTPLPGAIAMVPPGPTPTATPTPTPIPPDAPSAFAGVLPAGAVGRLGQGRLHLVEPSPDGRYVAVGGSIGVWVYDAATTQQVWFARTDWMTNWRGRGQHHAGGRHADREIRVWDHARGMELYTMSVHERGVTSLDWSPDSTRLISAAQDGVGVIWDLSNDDPPIALIRTDEPPGLNNYQTMGFNTMYGALSPDGRLYATIYRLGEPGYYSGFDNVIILWDAVTGAQLRILRGWSLVAHLAWLPDSTRLVAGLSEPYVDVGMCTRNVNTLATTRSVRPVHRSPGRAATAPSFWRGTWQSCMT
jgi:hypothetical protein